MIMEAMAIAAPFKTVSKCLKHWSEKEPSRPAFVFTDVNWRRTELSRKDIFEYASKYASILHKQGVTRGDIVCNTLSNSPERLITEYGCVLAGATSLNGQVFLADGNDFFCSLRKANCCAVIIDPEQPKGAKEILERHVHKQHGTHVNYPELPCLRLVLACSWETHSDNLSLMDVIKNEPDRFVDDVEPDDGATIFTTSGSTGFSKLVPRTHEQLLCYASNFNMFTNVQDDDIYYNDRPLGWAGGYPLVYLVRGSTRVLTDQSRGQAEDQFEFMWKLIVKEQCTAAFMVPYHVERLTHSHPHLIRDFQSKLNCVATAGQPVKKIHVDAIGRITKSMVVGYGSTEAGIISWKKVTDPTDYEDCSNGLPGPDTQVKVVDNKTLEEVPIGQMGEMLVRGKCVCRMYMSNEKATKESFLSDGWFRTGDVGHLDSSGEVHVICREKFAIMHGSYVIYPGWLEVRILDCPGVQNAVIIPVPDPVLHQEICACIVPEVGKEVTAEKVQEFCKGLFLTKSSSEMTAVPKFYLIFSVFPTTTTGKTCRNTLKKLVYEKLRVK